MITFVHPDDFDNGIPLCPNCHANFHDIYAPGFTFFPSDLQYFIDFEEEDFRRRQREVEMGRLAPARVCPAAQAYKTHQVELRAVDEGAGGGLYQRYMLHDFLPTIISYNDITTLPLKSWHGAPMASLRRTFQIYGDPLSGAIPAQQREQLRKLQDLYMRPAPVRSEDGVERRASGLAITHEGDQASAAREADGPGFARLQTVNFAGSRKARQGAASGVSTAEAAFALEVLGAYGGEVRSANWTYAPESQPSRKRRHAFSDDSDHSETRRKHSRGRKSRRRATSEQQWQWGPSSSSRNKAISFPAMMGWRPSEVEAE